MEYPSYTYPVSSLRVGSSLGNFYTFARLSADTDLKGLWSAIDDQYYLGEWNIDLFIDGIKLEAHSTEFNPESQETRYGEGHIDVRKRFLIPFSTDRRSQQLPSVLQAAIFIIRFTNNNAGAKQLLIRQSLVFPARPSELFIKQPPPDQCAKRVDIHEKEGRFEILTRGKPGEARIVGSPLPLRNQLLCDETLIIEYSLPAGPGETVEAPFVLAYSAAGVESADKIYLQCQHATDIAKESIAEYKKILSRTDILTPDPAINRGVRWAKVNAVRVQHKYRTGEAFTNDPPQDIVVIRDLAWYAFGSDYITPEFSANTLSIAERHAFHENGKLTEFIRANEEPAALHDYGLNINDDTPLYVCALFHHALLGNSSYTPESAYPPMKRACDYILSQVEDGLVRCHSNGTNVWGICGWRNIIDGYNLTGAVTEINCECYYALRCTADVAALVGQIEESRRYLRAAERLRDEVNEKLVSEKTGLYLLNLADDGTRHHDITGDLIFPVLFGVAEPAMKKKILKKLTEADIWTPFGARTVSKNEANYDPDLGCQLLGGVWPNLTAWIAYCVREENPAKLVEGMLNIYKLSEPERPADFVNVVPGEFPERLHGETFESRGMAMSPWMPPTYVWLAIEGLFGVRSSLGGLIMSPAIPPNWNWIAVRNLPYNGMTISAFVLEGVIYSNIALKSSLPVKTGELVEAFADNDSILCIAIKIAEEIAVFAASDEGGDGTISIVQDGFIISESISLARGEAKLFSISTKVRVEER